MTDINDIGLDERTATSWRDILPVHPACAMWGPLPPDDFKALAADLRQYGLYEPITVRREGANDLVLLDGCNRLDALEYAGFSLVRDGKLDSTLGHAALGLELGIAAIVELDPDVNPYEFVVSRNAHRRHLTAARKRDLIAALLKADPSRSDREIGRIVKADNKTVASVRAEKETREEIPHVSTRTDSKGRQQPAAKSAVRARGPTHVCWQCGRRGKVSEVRQHHCASYEDGDVWLHDACIGAFHQAERQLKVAGELHDIEPDSPGELERLRARVEELQAEIEELKATRVDHLNALQLDIDLLERRLERDGINATAQLQKIRDRIEQSRLQIDLAAVPVSGSA